MLTTLKKLKSLAPKNYCKLLLLSYSLSTKTGKGVSETVHVVETGKKTNEILDSIDLGLNSGFTTY